MLFSTRSAVLALSLMSLVSCATTTALDPNAQSLVESIAGANDNVLRLSVHAIPAGETGYKAVASTSAAKLNKVSDPEDLKAIETGEIQVLDEPGGIDVTVPIGMQNGKHTVAAGVTLKAGMGREAAIAAAKAIASQLDGGLMNAASKK